MHDDLQPRGHMEKQNASINARCPFAKTDRDSSSPDSGRASLDITEFEKRIIALTMAGYSLRERAALLGRGQQALRLQILKLCERLGVEGELELILFALNYQLAGAAEPDILP